ncbi:MAG TPA: lysylphosphatidylglycerol synthase transmembrane domain-containing protein [Gemmatimonadaceae bacterium]|nr:lysylphosphatidylglycerol synthase transmembrane domain-containing protein [Gemmatimonadaceae bacterium]
MTASRRRLLRIGGLVVLAALLALFARTLDWRSTLLVLRGADPRLVAAALAVNLLSLGLKGVRWWVFLRPLGDVPLPLVLRATFAGASLNNLVVAQGGEGARVLLVSRAAGVSSAGVLAALALERALDAVSYLVLLVAAAWLVDLPPHIARWRAGAAAALGLAVLVLVIVGGTARRRAGDPLPVAAGGGRLTDYVRRMRSGGAMAATPGRLAAALLISLAAWALQVATYHLAARAAQLPLPLAGSVAAMLAVGISFLVRATPGNVGIFQVIYALTVRWFGVAEGPAIAVALLIQTLQVVPTVVVGSIVAPRLLRGTADGGG